jgi:DNA-binding MarR family transcriptional regulator
VAKHNATGRSKAHDARHVRIYESMAQTSAWRGLSGLAMKAWVAISFMHNGRNNGAIAVSSRDLGRRIGITYQTAAKIVLELENAGFLRVTRASAFQTRRATEYRLTHLRNDITGEAPSHEYRRARDAVDKL